jgi:hypothetical protein
MILLCSPVLVYLIDKKVANPKKPHQHLGATFMHLSYTLCYLIPKDHSIRKN